LATVTAIIYSSPLIITAIAALFLNEKVGLGRWVAVMVGFVGVIVVARPTSDSFDAVVLFPLGAALCYSVYQLATRALSVRDGPLTTVFWTGLGGCLVISPALPWTWQAPDVAGWALLATYGVLGFTSHFTLVLAYRHASASVLAPFFYVQLVLAIVAGVVFFHSFPDAWTFFGILLICGSGIYVWYSQRRQRGGAATRDNSS